MQEAFIHFIWKYQYFNKTDLKTTDGLQVNIQKPGNHNTDSGPDFNEATVIIDQVRWAGSIEIHTCSSHWETHRHTEDPAYDNVVLHVVWRHDKNIKRNDGTEIPTIELSHRVKPSLTQSYKVLSSSLQPVPCSDQLGELDSFVISSMLDKMTAERLEHKMIMINEYIHKYRGDWEVVTFIVLAKNFGFKTNALQFQRLAELIPTNLISRSYDTVEDIEALLFGQGGFLEGSFKDLYQEQLADRYTFIKHKYGLSNSMSKFNWKFMRLRPANFPTLRIAQLASLMRHTEGLFARIKLITSVSELYKLFDIKTSPYWYTHYRFGNESNGKVGGIGASSIQNIGINTIAPLLAAYSKYGDQQVYMDQALELLRDIHPEHNRVTKVWSNLGLTLKNAFDSQAYIQLYNNYCSKNRCLDCNLGVKILQR